MKKLLATGLLGVALLTQSGCDDIEIEIEDGFFGRGHGYYEPVYYVEEVWYDSWYDGFWLDSFFWY